MTLGELYDKLTAIDVAKEAIKDAERSLGFGGNARTMKIKNEQLSGFEQDLADLRDEELYFQPGPSVNFLPATDSRDDDL